MGLPRTPLALASSGSFAFTPLSISAMQSISTPKSPCRGSRFVEQMRARARRSPRVAMTVDVTFVIDRSAIARKSAISALSSPRRKVWFTFFPVQRKQSTSFSGSG